MYVYVWEFHVLPDRLDAFEKGYGAEGEWTQLFRRDAGYVRTELLADSNEAGRYLTIDYWLSREAQEAFLEHNRARYEALDRSFEDLTSREELVGRFEVLT